MSRHDTDSVGFFFGICFLVTAALAIGVRAGDIGFGVDGPGAAWVAGSLLAVVGLVGVIGTLSGRRRQSSAQAERPSGEEVDSEPRDLDADETKVLDPPGPVA